MGALHFVLSLWDEERVDTKPSFLTFTLETAMTAHVIPPIGVIGYGTMASAMVERWLDVGLVKGSNLTASIRRTTSPSLERIGIEPSSNQRVVDESEVILLGIKPYQLDAVTSGVEFRANQIVLSILAGTPFETLKAAVAPACAVRLMPNLAVRLGKGIVAEVGVSHLAEARRDWVKSALAALGTVVSLPDETLFDGVTALAGSAPAFCFVFAQALADAGVLQGLSRSESQSLAAGVLEGAGASLRESDLSPEILKDRVASPKGTTISGLRALEARGFRSAVIEAVAASANRSAELSKG
jgi:pyrroline-5-carboxylate reductase